MPMLTCTNWSTVTKHAPPPLNMYLYFIISGSTDALIDNIDEYNRSFTPTLSSLTDSVVTSYSDSFDANTSDSDMLTATPLHDNQDQLTVPTQYVDQITVIPQRPDHELTTVITADYQTETTDTVKDSTSTTSSILPENVTSPLLTPATDEGLSTDLQNSTSNPPPYITREEQEDDSTTTDVISQISDHTHTSTLSISRLTTTQDMMSHISDISRVNTVVQAYNTMSTVQVNSDTVTANNGSDTTDHMTEATASVNTLQDYHTEHGNSEGETTTIQNLDGTSIDLNRNNSLSVVSSSKMTTESGMDMTQHDNLSKNTSQHTAPPDAVPITSEFSTYARIVSHVTTSAMFNSITDDNDVTIYPVRMTSDPEKGGAITEEGGASSVMVICKLLAR